MRIWGFKSTIIFENYKYFIITQRRSFEYIRYLLEIIKTRSSINKININLIGNKKDLEKI